MENENEKQIMGFGNWFNNKNGDFIIGITLILTGPIMFFFFEGFLKTLGIMFMMFGAVILLFKVMNKMGFGPEKKTDQISS